MQDKEYHAVRVDPTNALIPKPTQSLLIELAMGIHLSVAGSACVARNEDESSYPEWDALNEETKQYWIEGAKCAYSVIAVHGGAEIIKIPNPDA